MEQNMTEQSTGTVMTLTDKIKAQPYWYHWIELPGGVTTPGWAPLDAARYCIPQDLTGKRVLDIGAWDGFWTWEALKRGAKEVVAIDEFSDSLGAGVGRENKWATFDICREAFGFTESIGGVIGEEDGPVPSILGWRNGKSQIVSRLEMSVYDLHPLSQHFDVVFFFGTIYHLKHPLLALEKISAICDGEIYIESAVCDDYSPYRGGLNHGYPNNDMVTEFYPGPQYGNNPSNWWAPTLQCLGAMVESVGFKAIEAWPLVEQPRGLPHCRGFVYGSKTGAANPLTAQYTATTNARATLSVASVMSIPRLGFQDNMMCVFEGLVPLHIPILKVQGAFWGQCLERGICQQIDAGADAVLTIDYDTVFKMQDVADLIQLMIQHPEADAIVPLQMGRAGMNALMTIKTRSGNVTGLLPRETFTPQLTKIATGHFGLTLLRSASLLKLPHPWFLPHPDADGRWGGGRVDEDIHFWKQMEQAGMTVYSANHIVLGHLQLVATFPDENLQPIYQAPQEFYDTGRPAKCWK